MGLRRSILRRHRLAQGFPPAEALMVFFGSQEFRRRVRCGAVQKTMSLPEAARGRLFRLTHLRTARALHGICDGDTDRSYLLVALGREVLDPAWYQAHHRLAGPRAALGHFLTIGLQIGLAPAAAYADADGEALSPWGREFLARLGLPVQVSATVPGNRRLDWPVAGRSPDRTLPPPAGPSMDRATGPAVDSIATPPGSALPLQADLPRLDPRQADLTLRSTRGQRLAVAAACFSDQDRLPDIDPDWADQADFYLFTDRPDRAGAPWIPVRANYHTTDPRRRALFYKTHLTALLGAYDWALWLDPGIRPRRAPQALVAALAAEGAAFGLPARQVARGLVEEAVACLEGRLERSEVLRDHLARAASHPGFAGAEVLETRLMLLRPGAPAVRRLCGAWWRHLANGARCDQLSLPLALAESPDLDWRRLPSRCTDVPPP